MSQFIKIKSKISSVLVDPDLANTLVKELRKSTFIVMREYFKEAPVMNGDLRLGIRNKNVKGGYSVNTITTNAGRPYPLYVHQGTGVFKKVQADFPSTGRVRSGESRMNRGSGGIRPNKFAKRASENAMPLVLDYMVDTIDNLSSTLMEI